ncbi:hypothetical protein AYI69_g4337 [Smittium culicis]|uniref:Zn(2)-C6 fungal-type domain-containing protein n=1 Tax=Smittium culicis TaxID=133412 RepID=A0A1R1YEK0_9FUNG|nr:hypothetical protein AYI69_g4337 [Smittium culicis]
MNDAFGVSKHDYTYRRTNPIFTATTKDNEGRSSPNSKIVPFKTTIHGGALYSCVVCRQKKVKCDGERPKCKSCIKFDRMCNYEETTFTEDLTLDFQYIEEKLKKVNDKITSLKLQADPDSPAGHQPPKNRADRIEKLNIGLATLLKDKLNISDSLIPVGDAAKNVNVSSIITRSALEFGCLNIDNDMLNDVLKQLFNGSVVSQAISKIHFLKRLEKNDIPLHLKLSILSLGSKLYEKHVIYKDHIYMCGTAYANKAYEELFNNPSKPTPDTILTLVILANHYLGLANTQRVSNILIDVRKLPEFIDAEDWEELEYRRRVWWLLYTSKVLSNFTLGSSNWIQIKDVCVNLPSNDIYYCRAEKSGYIPKSLLKNISNEARDKYDSFWLIVKIYIEIEMVSEFVNKRKLSFNRDNNDASMKFNYLSARLDEYDLIFRSHFSDLEIGKDQSFLLKINDNRKLARRTFTYFYCGLLARLARLVLNQNEIVITSLNPTHLSKVRKAKSVCIEMAIQIASLLKSADDFFITSRHCFSSVYSAYCAGSILLNALKIYDHNDYSLIKESYQNIFTILKKIEGYMKVAYDYEKSLRSNHNIYTKSVSANAKYLDKFPELKVTRLTKKDVHLWFVVLGSSGMSYMCCSVSSVCPKYKYVFIESWIDSEILLSRQLTSQTPKNQASDYDFNYVTYNSTILPVLNDSSNQNHSIFTDSLLISNTFTLNETEYLRFQNNSQHIQTAPQEVQCLNRSKSKKSKKPRLLKIHRIEPKIQVRPDPSQAQSSESNLVETGSEIFLDSAATNFDVNTSMTDFSNEFNFNDYLIDKQNNYQNQTIPQHVKPQSNQISISNLPILFPLNITNELTFKRK